jgi:hypothetical protein
VQPNLPSLIPKPISPIPKSFKSSNPNFLNPRASWRFYITHISIRRNILSLIQANYPVPPGEEGGVMRN